MTDNLEPKKEHHDDDEDDDDDVDADADDGEARKVRDISPTSCFVVSY